MRFGKVSRDFCKMDIGPIFFKEILFLDFLEEWTPVPVWAVVKILEGGIEEQDSPFLK